jgi:tetratricopeptide (TPR) repeat protein
MRTTSPVPAVLAFLLVLFVLPGMCTAAAGMATPVPPATETSGTYDRSLPPLPNVSFATQTPTAQDWYEQGFVLTNEGRYADALVAYGEALSRNRSLLNAWYYTGDALFRLGRYSEAILAFSNATAVDPDFVDAYFYESLVFEKLGRYQDRKDALQEGLSAADRKKAAEEKQAAVPAIGHGSLPVPLPPVVPMIGIALAVGLRSLTRKIPDS